MDNKLFLPTRDQILGLQASILAAGDNRQEELLAELEVLQGIVNFCEIGTAEDAPRIAHLAESRALGVWSALNEAEHGYLQARHEHREQLKGAAKQVYDTVRQTLETLLTQDADELP